MHGCTSRWSEWRNTKENYASKKSFSSFFLIQHKKKYILTCRKWKWWQCQLLVSFVCRVNVDSHPREILQAHKFLLSTQLSCFVARPDCTNFIFRMWLDICHQLLILDRFFCQCKKGFIWNLTEHISLACYIFVLFMWLKRHEINALTREITFAQHYSVS